MIENISWQDNTLVADHDPRYGVFSGTFGGWTAAHAMHAAQQLTPPEQTPIALTIDFLKGIGPGRVRSAPQVRAQTKSTSFIDITTSQSEIACARTSIITNRRRATDSIAALAPPAVPLPESIAASDFSHPIATWIEQYEMRFAKGTPLTRAPQMRSLAWMRERPTRAWSWATLAALADANLPRIFFHYDTLTPIATITMSVHFHIDAAALAALGDDFVLVDASSAIAHAGLFDQTVRVWSRAGALVLSSTQMAVFNVVS
jgi:acyl-CoA thioesterase